MAFGHASGKDIGLSEMTGHVRRGKARNLSAKSHVCKCVVGVSEGSRDLISRLASSGMQIELVPQSCEVKVVSWRAMGPSCMPEIEGQCGGSWQGKTRSR